MNDQWLIKSIWSTLCYYDALDYPLTEWEIKRWLIADNSSFSETDELDKGEIDIFQKIRKSLREDNFIKSRISYRDGYYVLKNREYLIPRRIIQEKIAIRKIKGLQRAFFWLRETPFLRAVIVTGRLALKNTNKKSDWDVLIIARAGRIWTVRTWITLLVWLLGKKRSQEKTQDKVCLNYFITDKSLEISLQDLFAAHEYSVAFPLFDTENIFHQFKISNNWIKQVRPFYLQEESLFKTYLKDSYVTVFLRKTGEFILGGRLGNYLEKWLSSWQKTKIDRNPLTHLPKSLVKVSSRELVFLPHPHGPQVFEKFMHNLGYKP